MEQKVKGEDRRKMKNNFLRFKGKKDIDIYIIKSKINKIDFYDSKLEIIFLFGGFSSNLEFSDVKDYEEIKKYIKREMELEGKE